MVADCRFLLPESARSERRLGRGLRGIAVILLSATFYQTFYQLPQKPPKNRPSLDHSG
jgi:hypothetical protein